jgi:hypothetical protein
VCIQRCRILQVVEKESEWMLCSCEYADESPEDKLETTLRILWR